MSSGGSPPPAPDYVGAANAQGQQQIQNTETAQQGSLISQYTPYGSLVYSEGPNSPQGNPTYQSNVSLSPTEQQLLSQQQGAQTGIAPGLSSLTNQVNQSYQNPITPSSLTGLESQVMGNEQQLLQPQMNLTTEQANTQAINQGLQPGSQAYQNAMLAATTQNNNLELGAANQAISQIPTALNVDSTLQNLPATEMGTLLGYSNPTSPTFGNTPNQQVAQAGNTLGAAQSQGTFNQGVYNTQVGQQNSMTSGLFGIGSAGINSGLFSGTAGTTAGMYGLGGAAGGISAAGTGVVADASADDLLIAAAAA